MDKKISALKTVTLFLGVLFLVLLFFVTGATIVEFNRVNEERAFCAVVYPEEQKLLESEPEVEAYLGSDYDVYKGEILFKTKCAACHKTTKDLVGPRMAGLLQRIPKDKDWLYTFLTNEESLLVSDEYAQQLNDEYGNQMNHQYKELEETALLNLSGYILQFD